MADPRLLHGLGVQPRQGQPHQFHHRDGCRVLLAHRGFARGAGSVWSLAAGKTLAAERGSGRGGGEAGAVCAVVPLGAADDGVLDARVGLQRGDDALQVPVLHSFSFPAFHSIKF